MKKKSAIFALLFLFSCGELEKKFHHLVVQQNEKSALLASEEFVQGSEDIPLPVGMEKILDDSVGFDSESGSIISSSYSTTASLEQVRKFYLTTLPQMGWSLTSSEHNSLNFQRDKEKLEIELATETKENIVKFLISLAL
ncbi:MAG: hypothetical protein FJX34_05590 [Alphaproteobacteria bacterium]|nr:hypothetical protein [Alphaproteobacteria bacterium]